MPTLDWLDREQAMRHADTVSYRLLEHVSTHGDPAAGNLLIQGDNLEALKALLPFYRGRVKCIYIDPPYNTKIAFEHYDDNLEHEASAQVESGGERLASVLRANGNGTCAAGA